MWGHRVIEPDRRVERTRSSRRLRGVLVPLLILSCAAVGGGPAEAAVDDYIGKPIASVRVLIEGRETDDPGLRRIVQTRVGQPLSMPAVRESITHLISLGRFDEAQIDASLVDGNRVALRYELSPIHPITKIEFSGARGAAGVDTGQLRKALSDRYGASLPLGRNPELTAVVAESLGDRGYLHPQVKPRAVITHRPERTTLFFDIDPGPRTTVGDIGLVGTPSVSVKELLNRLGLASGVPYQRRDLDARIDRYLAERRKAGYYEAKLVVTPRFTNEDRVVNLTLMVTPGPHVRVVFTGDPLPSDARADLVPIETEGSVDEDLLEDSTNRIEDYLRGLGYRDAKAPHERKETKEDELLISFDVKRGRAYRVSRLEISGNASVPLSEFVSMLRLRDGQPFSEAKLDADVSMLETLYRRRGFASVKAQSGEEALPVSGNEGFVPLTVRIAIAEGPRTEVASVHVKGNVTISEVTLTEKLGLQPGQPYSDTQLVLDRDAIQLQYLNHGFLNATVEANPGFNADRTRAEPVFTVREGSQIFVEHILIVGNVRTSTDTIERELQIKPDDPLSAEARVDSQRRLMELAIFRRVQINDLRSADETHRDLLVTVEESPPTTLAWGGGVEGRLRVVRSEENQGIASERLEFAPRGSFEIGRRNFFGKNRTANLFTSVSLHPKDAPFFAEQTSTPSTESTGFGFTEYRVLGQFREPKIFATSADVLFSATLEQQIRSSFNFARRSASAEVARGVTRQLGVVASYQIQRTRVFDENINQADLQARHLLDVLFPQVRLSSGSVTLIRDTRDDQIEPRSGFYTSGKVQLAARRIGSEVGFLQTYWRTRAFHALPQAHGIVLAGSAQLGLATGFPRDVIDQQGNPQTIEDLPASERFFAGGDTTIRGFALDAVGTPQTLDRDGFPLGGNAMVIFNAEVRAPLRGGIGVVGFLDSGNVFARASDVNLTELRSAVGFGVRYKSPVGPIRFDMGFKIHPQEIGGRREGPFAIHVSFGQAF